MDIRTRFGSFLRALPLAQQVGVGVALVALVMLGVVFARWVTSPSYTVLYADLPEGEVATVVDALETAGTPYRLEGGGRTVLVPREELYGTRASLATEGLGGPTTPEGYELLDEQGLSVSDFRQRVDYQRALEGELERTLSAMQPVETADVRLVLPEEELFSERQQPVTASVLLTTGRDLDPEEVETVAFLVSSGVEGLETEQITIADAKGQVLQAPGDNGSVALSRNLRETREFEQALAGDVQQLLAPLTGGKVNSVVVRANLDFNESETESETYDPDNQVALQESVQNETFEGAGAPPGANGTVGVDGGPEGAAADAEDSNYQREESVSRYGVNRVAQRTIAAPGRVQRLSVAIVMDDGSDRQVDMPARAEIEELVSAAAGLDADRGDTIAVTAAPLPAQEEPEELAPEGGMDMLDLLSTVVAVIVLLVVAVALLLMTRRRKETAPEPSTELVLHEPEEVEAIEEPRAEPRPDPVAAMASPVKDDVTQLVQRQPEEIATLLRSWLADRRS